eukprot:COSAG02_NODE_37094_length_446_cov_1.118156_1_plen_64_part_00
MRSAPSGAVVRNHWDELIPFSLKSVTDLHVCVYRYTHILIFEYVAYCARARMLFPDQSFDARC